VYVGNFKPIERKQNSTSNVSGSDISNLTSNTDLPF